MTAFVSFVGCIEYFTDCCVLGRMSVLVVVLCVI
jgi:hypothetical protein